MTFVLLAFLQTFFNRLVACYADGGAGGMPGGMGGMPGGAGGMPDMGGASGAGGAGGPTVEEVD